jgi:tRNA pseudouridine38-40 synthase
VEVSEQRWIARCAYNGGAFAGWQSQPGKNGVQDVIEARLREIFGRPIRIHGSGRTDAGVHARRQVFHFDAAWAHGTPKLLAALRNRLPAALQIIGIRAGPRSFHARFSATGKVYEYEIHLGDADPFRRPFCWPVFRSLDLEAMGRAAARLVGKHDFRAFSAWNGGPGGDTVRHLRRLDLRQRGKRVRIVAEADGFLYKMVRSLAGALVAVGEGKLTTDEIERLLRTGERTAAVHTAPPQGLFLDRVFYR